MHCLRRASHWLPSVDSTYNKLSFSVYKYLLRNSSGTSGKKVAELIQIWTNKFLKNKVPEAEDSIKYILSSILSLKNVKGLTHVLVDLMLAHRLFLKEQENCYKARTLFQKLESLPGCSQVAYVTSLLKSSMTSFVFSFSCCEMYNQDTGTATHLEYVRHQILTPDEYQMLLVKADLRLKRIPVQYIIGEWEFCGLTLKMRHSPSVFIPRPETEDLVFIVSDIIVELMSCNKRDKVYNPSCFEVGCGSGAISLALLSKHEELRCTAIDANPAAVSLARLNSEILGLTDKVSFSIAKLEEDGIVGFNFFNSTKYDILVSNPPYIPTYEINDLAPEIARYEDHLALDGGPDGTRVIKQILRHAPKWLREGSYIVLEIDPRQTKTIMLISEECASYVGEVDVRKDCFGVERFVILRCK